MTDMTRPYRAAKDKKRPPILAGLFAVLFLGTLAPELRAQETDIEAMKKTAPKVYIDCSWCDINYIRTEITFVNYVRDRKEAQIHALITTQSTGSGGDEYTLTFLGQNEFEGDNDTVRFFTGKMDTSDEIRKALVNYLKMGLMRYAAKTPISGRISISHRPVEKREAVVDRWNSWVFSIGGSGYYSGEKSYSFRMLNGSVSANRVTPESKLRLGLSVGEDWNFFEYEGQEIISRSTSQSFSGLYVKSIGDHWSVGVFLNAASSTYNNIKFSFSPAPAVEYDLFPYSQSTRRQLRFLYRLSFQNVRYREETIYDKIQENLLSEDLSVTLELKEKWGSISTSLEGSHYFKDFSKYNLNLSASLSLNLLKGLTFDISGGGSRIHDQLFIPKGEATLEEVLLQRRQLETTYSYYVSVGFSYTFGSIFTNVVNPRFGSSGMSMSMSF